MFRWARTLGLATLWLLTGCGGDRSVADQPRTAAPAPAPTARKSAPRGDIAPTTGRVDNQRLSTVGFRSRAQFNEHFQKHGAEFGRITQQEYLRAAQALRDAPVGGNIEEIKRNDGTVSRFDRSTGAFLAFNRDGTIRTFFKPNDGEAYFRRQASRVH